VGAGSGDWESEVVKAAVVDVDMQGLSAAEAEERRSPRAAAEPPGLPVLLLLRQERLLLHSGARAGAVPGQRDTAVVSHKHRRDSPSLSQKQKRDSGPWNTEEQNGDSLPYLSNTRKTLLSCHPSWHALGKLCTEGKGPHGTLQYQRMPAYHAS